MRLGFVVVLCLLSAGCAIVRKDAEEPVDNEPRTPKAEPVLKPSEALKPKSLQIASPITDHFYVRGTFFPAAVTTEIRLDPTTTIPGTLLSAEDDLGLDDQIDQGRMEFDIRMGDRTHVRMDYFKLNRFSEQPLPRDIVFGDFIFPEGTNFRTKLDWRMLNTTITYSFIKNDRIEAGVGLGIHLMETHASGGEPGTLNREETDEVGIFPTIAGTFAWRFTNRFSFTARGQQFTATPEDFDGTLSDYHADVQFRWRKNLAFGLGYSILKTDLKVFDADQPLLFNMETAGPEVFFRASF